MIEELLSTYNQLLKEQPIIAGAVSLYGLTVVGWICRSVPSKIWGFIKRQSSTTLYINNTSVGTNLESFNNFLRWFEHSKWARLSRTLSLQGGWSESDDGTVVGIGDGNHFCFYRGRPVWINRTKLQTAGVSYQVSYEVRVTMMGRRRDLIEELIEEFRHRTKPEDIGVFMYRNEWQRVGQVRKRNLNTVILDPDIKSKLIQSIDRWTTQEQWYSDRGFAYKLTVLLHGPVGTGKTSIIKALAGHYRRDLCLLQLSSMSDETFRKALADAPDNAIIALEDFDDVPAIHARTGVVKAPQERTEDSKGTNEDDTPKPISPETTAPAALLQGVTMSGVLQALDGLLSLDGKMIFLTTNRPEILDAAILRKGRINLSLEIGPLKSSQIHEYIQLMYPEYDYDRTIQFASISGCDLEDHYKQTIDEPERFIEVLPKSRASLNLVYSETAK